MPLTVGQVAALPDLGLSVRTSAADLDRDVRWVAVSEHADPTPWLEGGDLLLTTGMSIAGDAAAGGRAYVDRLVAADVAALGFGVGPVAPVGARRPRGRRGGGRAAAARGAAADAVRRPEQGGVAAAHRRGVRRVGGVLRLPAPADPRRRWRRARPAAGVDARSWPSTSAASPSTSTRRATSSPRIRRPSAGRAAELAGEVDRLRPRGLLASAAVATADEHVVILPIGVKGAAEGFLVVGSPAAAALGGPGRHEPGGLAAVVARRPGRSRPRRAWMPGVGCSSTVAPSTAWRRTCWTASGCPTSRPGGRSGVAVRGVHGAAVSDADLAAGHRSGLARAVPHRPGGRAGFAAADEDGAPCSRRACSWPTPGRAGRRGVVRARPHRSRQRAAGPGAGGAGGGDRIGAAAVRRTSRRAA